MEAAIAGILEWDTAFFGVRIGRLARGSLDASQARALSSWARAKDVACVYCLFDADDLASARVAETGGANRVDVRATYLLDLARRSPRPDAPREGVRLARRSDLPDLERIAGAAHHDSRFYADPRFPRERVAELYRTWIRRSVEGTIADGAVTLDVDGRAAGYVTFSRPQRTGEAGVGAIGLVAIDERARGRGTGTALVDAALTTLGAGGARQVRVVTQGRNLGARKFYEQEGFRLERVEVWFHFWTGLAPTCS